MPIHFKIRLLVFPVKVSKFYFDTAENLVWGQFICSLSLHFLCSTVREKMKGPSDVRWLRTVLSSGTLRDKVAARTLIIQVPLDVWPCAQT